MMLHPNSNGTRRNNTTNGSAPVDAGLARHGKRKAVETPESNERLSKRLSLLNLEASGPKLYVPVESSRETPAVQPPPVAAPQDAPNVPPSIPEEVALTNASMSPVHSAPPSPPLSQSSSARQRSQRSSVRSFNGVGADDDMRVDDTKYKVYIYNIDDELADDERSASDTDTAAGEDDVDGDGKLVLLPDIDKHLRLAARTAALSGSSTKGKLAIPRPILPNKDGELAGMQLVLYNDPSSLSVPRESDSVRKAILDARARIRERQQEDKAEQELALQPETDASMASTPADTPRPFEADGDSDAMDID
ncbi:hypothetical protein HMPREF1624_00469 [Sporothrix schenckii ATCC 58251]|uniref:Uncharacterized protein n=1 Tax=Sporothrix schenckii (strain ATCC 58251 / de Perez 2211183) TaxID=1391915 RepID=U7Q622_SPOS1|nr:hypothetical protein HMPREF1624_00469 [Sporothrix schenckii ATCC 58251]